MISLTMEVDLRMIGEAHAEGRRSFAVLVRYQFGKCLVLPAVASWASRCFDSFRELFHDFV